MTLEIFFGSLAVLLVVVAIVVVMTSQNGLTFNVSNWLRSDKRSDRDRRTD